MADWNERVNELFLTAIDIESDAQRSAYLDQACAADAELRGPVETLLKAHLAAATFLGRPAVVGRLTELDPVPRLPPGTMIGRYKLLEPIGEGGYGTVFMAEQTSPVQRKVALKIIKAGMDTRQVIARFEAERQALALMDHPNIAKVFDAGVTDAGRPYFVMELVRGVPITRYCDEHHLTPRDRLELFVQVCHAVQHAHQKGIIHRDLKPTNVLVAQYDGKPVPKVIDFGIAKATGQPLTERTIFTGFGDVIGTLEYMSPEQAEVNQLDVDTRSDIYSLGVLLYELLTGTTPLEHKRVMKAGLLEMLRVVREEEPPKPSLRLSNSEQLASISANRGIEPKKLSGLVKGELDWIVMKSLEKDRGRRYGTANGFATDVQHYLDDEAVQACPPSGLYKLRKFARRNKRAVLVGVVVCSLLVLGTVGTAIGMARALRAERAATAFATTEARLRREAETQRDRAVTAERLSTDRLADVTREKNRATAARVVATEEAAIAQAVNDFLQNDLLAQAAPKNYARAKQVTVEEVLGRAAGRITGKFEKQPRVEAAIRHTIGDAYDELGDYAAAQPHLERALELRRRVLGEEHLDTLTSMNSLALLYRAQGHYAKAEPLYLKTLEIKRRVLGEEHPHTLTTMNNLAALYKAQGQYPKAEPLFVKALEVRCRVLGEEHPGTLRTMSGLASLYHAQGRFAKAEPLLVKTLDGLRHVQGEEHPDTLTAMSNLAALYRDQAQYAKAEPLYVKAMEVMRRVLGEEHPDTLVAMNNLAVLYLTQGQYAKAEPLFDKALEVRRRTEGEEHPHTLASMGNMASLYQDQGQFAKADLLYVKAVEISRRILGEEHPITLSSMGNLSTLYQDQGQYAKAESLVVTILEVRRRVLGDEHPDTLTSMTNLALIYENQGEFSKSEPFFMKVLEVRRSVLGEEHPDTLSSLNNLALPYQDQGQFAKAEPLYVTAVEVSGRVLGVEHPSTLLYMNNLAGLYRADRQFAKAEPLLVKALEVRRRTLGEEHPSTLRSMSGLAALYQDRGQYAQAEPLHVKTLEVSRRVFGEGHPQTLVAMNRLGWLYEAQGQFAKAEPLFRETLEKTRKHHAEAWKLTADALVSLGHSLLRHQKYADAAPLLRECLNIREQKQPDEWHTFHVRSLLGASLLGQKKYADAEPLLLAGYHGIHEREERIPAASRVRLTEALERLVRLYEERHEEDKAAVWRMKLPPRTETGHKAETLTEPEEPRKE